MILIFVSEFSIISGLVSVGEPTAVSICRLLHYLKLDEAFGICVVLFNLPKLRFWALTVVESL